MNRGQLKRLMVLRRTFDQLPPIFQHPQMSSILVREAPIDQHGPSAEDPQLSLLLVEFVQIVPECSDLELLSSLFGLGYQPRPILDGSISVLLLEVRSEFGYDLTFNFGQVLSTGLGHFCGILDGFTLVFDHDFPSDVFPEVNNVFA